MSFLLRILNSLAVIRVWFGSVCPSGRPGRIFVVHGWAYFNKRTITHTQTLYSKVGDTRSL
jgi:hypothetical protein